MTTVRRRLSPPARALTSSAVAATLALAGVPAAATPIQPGAAAPSLDVLRASTTPPPVFEEDFAAGTAAWRGLATAHASDWVAGDDGDTTWVTIDNRSAASGSYIVPVMPVTLPDDFEMTVQLTVEQIGSGGNVSVVAGVPADATAIQSGGTALQVVGPGTIRTQRPVTNRICEGAAPVALGAPVSLTVQRYGSIIRFLVDGQQVASHGSPAAGGTIALGSYRSLTTVSSVAVRALDTRPSDFPAAAEGCRWYEPVEPQPVMTNQSGYDAGLPMRFTAPSAEDGARFTVRDASGAAVSTGTITRGVGDFSGLVTDSEGPFTVEVVGEAGTGTSTEFGVGPSWTSRVATTKALRFMAGSLCYFGDFSKVGRDALRSEALGPAQCRKAVAWRDASQYGFELTSLADMLAANPEIVLQVPGDPGLLTGMPTPLPADTPLVAQLLTWGAEVYLAEQVDEPQLKGQLAAFLSVYPLVAEWVPQDVYDRTLEYTLATWAAPGRDRFVWQAYTPDYDGNLLGVYTQVGTGKGELVPGHSILPNMFMHEVALRDGLADADLYLDAAVAQAQWIVSHLDVTDPTTTKGQRQSEWVTLTSLVRLAEAYPDDAPAATTALVGRWADVVIDRSDNLWDFRKYDSSGTSTDRWTIPAFTGGGQGEDPNEAGNVAGFAAPALAAASLLGTEDPRSRRLEEIAVSHIANIFGRNPTGRAAQYRVHDPDLAFEGLDKGWFSEFQGGWGILQGLPGVLDGSPKNAHYPYQTGIGNIGHTEGWVNINTALNETIAWMSRATTTVTLAGAATRSAHADVTAGSAVTVQVRGPLELERRAGLALRHRDGRDGRPGPGPPSRGVRWLLHRSCHHGRDAGG